MTDRVGSLGKSHKNLGRPPKFKPVNPIEAAITTWLYQLPADLFTSIRQSIDEIIARSPKRWVVYPPMVLLPTGSFATDWWKWLPGAAGHEDDLWILLLENIGKREGKGLLTHLAVNSGIPLLTKREHEICHTNQSENILRTPSGLVLLHGNFGPALPLDQAPSTNDFDEAFWVSSRQNGITQVWCPRYTMFSRGNVKEKKRVLDFHTTYQPFPTRIYSREEIASSTAIDLYAGIGYFVFSYVKLGMHRVIGYELNPWSVEGLRRGALENGWKVKVVYHEESLDLGDEKITIVLGDNKIALRQLQSVDPHELGTIRHVNGGLLPTSEMIWNMALQMVRDNGWLHLHENVKIDEIQTRRLEIESIFKEWLEGTADRRVAYVEHVELVKSFAPGIIHTVFDLRIDEALSSVWGEGGNDRHHEARPF